MGTEEEPSALKGFWLHQNYPNPFNPSTNISYSISEASNVKLVVFDLLGREVKVLDSGEKPAGTYTFSFTAENLSSGIYFYRLETNGYSETKRLSLIK